MASQLAAREPTTLAFEATVTDRADDAVALDTTYFYAESGGQPADRGAIAGRSVSDVYLDDGTTWHRLEGDGGPAIGDVVEAEIDEQFRRYCMAAHTASHAVYGAARQLFDELGYGGFEITPSKVRLDLTTPTPIDDRATLELERLTNQVIWEDRAVTWSTWPADEVRDNDEIALNVATDVVHSAETVRVVEIDGWDLAACGGTHVDATGKIGAVAMADRSNPGEGMTRIEFVVGPDRIEQRYREKRVAWAAKTSLGVPLEEVAGRIEDLLEERQALETQLEDMAGTVAAAAVTGPDAIRFDRNGASWAVGKAPSVDAGVAASVAESLVGDTADVVAIAGGTNRGQLVVATDGAVTATDVIDAVLERFDGGGGGGSPTSAQAGGLDGDASAVIDAVCKAYEVD